jgi:hypothetical protein|tara:strand:+ start:313 stop:1026 length:714 start_codon:yes stop_codon:yes gene_type:complete
MANRPVFLASDREGIFFEEKNVEFEWFAGMATSQKQKSINSLHKAAQLEGISDILEVSTKSEEVLGNQLSAFNLTYTTSKGKVLLLEVAFQGSKIFENGGPYHDLYDKDPLEVKKDERVSKDFIITGFDFQGELWNNEPKTAFYDWLYINAVNQKLDNDTEFLFENISGYSAFTDIEFNPKKSLNCQARSCAVFVSLVRKNLLSIALESRESFLDVLSDDPFYKVDNASGTEQGELF